MIEKTNETLPRWPMRYRDRVIEGITMSNEGKFKKSISIRCDEKMENMIDELEEKLLLNTTSVMRLALATLYKSQIEAGETNANLKFD